MKYIKSKCLQEAKGRKRGKYILTLEVSDYDLEMFEDFAITMAPNILIEEPSKKNDWNGIYSTDYKDKYRKWIMNVWSTFWTLWHKHDKEYQFSGRIHGLEPWDGGSIPSYSI